MFHVSINKKAGQAEKTVDFKDQQAAWEYRMNQNPDMTFGNADTSDTPQDFFERPVKIAEYEWNIGSTLFEQLQPWKEYFEEPRVANKMAHFRNLRCNLRLKFVLNGNPFYFGRVICSAQPLPHLDNITKFDVGVNGDFVQASQRPHVYLNPTTCEGGELVLPFFFYKNTLDITRAEWRDMGIVQVASLNPLQHANDASEPISISVFAMAENVDVSTPTSVLYTGLQPQSAETPIESEGDHCPLVDCCRRLLAVIGRGNPNHPPSVVSQDSSLIITHEKEPLSKFEPQSGETPAGGDEYGVVSAPAHQIANLAGDLSNAPIIGPYARATQMIASGVARMAQLFGFSRPRVVEEPCSYLPRHAGHLATTNVPDNIASLAVDAKKEVTVDGRVVGLNGMDEMALVPLACRESYLTTFNWSITDNPNQPLYSQRITPLSFNKEGPNYHLTPSAWTVLPFAYWKGSMEVRFKVVCSEYHRGRIRIVWDPLFFADAYAGIYNTNYTEVIDITETRDFSVRIGWGQQTSYLPVEDIEDLDDLLSPRDLYTTSKPQCNGALSVLVVNQLTTPASAAPIQINVYTKMCDDYEVAVPDCLNLVKLNITEFQPAFDEQNPDLGGGGGPGGPGPQPQAPQNPDALPDIPPGPAPKQTPEPTFFPYDSERIWYTGNDQNPVRTGGTACIPGNHGGDLSYGCVLQFNPTDPDLPYSAHVRLPTLDTLIPGGEAPVTLLMDVFYFTPPYGLNEPVNLEIWNALGTTKFADFTSTYGNIRNGSNNSITFTAPFAPGGTQFRIVDVDSATNTDHDRARLSIKKAIFPWPPDWRNVANVTTDYNDWYVLDDATSAILLPDKIAEGKPYVEATTPFTLYGNPLNTLPTSDFTILMDLDNPADAGTVLVINGSDPIVTRNPDTPGPKRDIMQYSETVDGSIGLPPVFNISSTGANITVRVYGFMHITDQPPLPPLLPQSSETPMEFPFVPQSGEDRIEDDDEANAPLQMATDMFIAPTCDSGQINSVHFGERITSWRQMLKRYNDVIRVESANNTQLILNDVEIDDPDIGVILPGFTANPEIPLMRWVRSGYLAKRGSIRYKVLVHARSNQIKSALMSRVCATDKVTTNLDNLPNSDMFRVSHIGSNFANISETGVVDAEVPWYSNLRFHPSRVFQDYVEDYDRGREFSWFRVDIFSNDGVNLIDVSQAGAEDLSFYFFLSAPIVTVKGGL